MLQSQLYAKHRSSDLAHVVLDSCLGEYDQELAISLLHATAAGEASGKGVCARGCDDAICATTRKRAVETGLTDGCPRVQAKLRGRGEPTQTPRRALTPVLRSFCLNWTRAALIAPLRRSQRSLPVRSSPRSCNTDTCWRRRP